MSTLIDCYTGATIPGDWLPTDDMEEDIECPECGSAIGQQCSLEDPRNPGMGIEIGTHVHASRCQPSLT